MKKQLFTLAILVALTAAAHATKPGNNGGGNGGCGVGQTTNGCGGTTPAAGGGAGGQGGAGGSSTAVGLGVGIGIAGAAATGGNATAAGGSATIEKGAVDNRNTNTNLNTNSNVLGQAQTALGGNANSTSGGNTITSSVNVAAQERDPVATAVAAALTASGASANNGTCFGSSSGGVQAATFGVSVGSTVESEACETRYDAIALRAAGKPEAAVARLCQTPKNREAMEDAGTPCPAKKAKTANVGTAPAGFENANLSDNSIRRRAGMTPL